VRKSQKNNGWQNSEFLILTIVGIRSKPGS